MLLLLLLSHFSRVRLCATPQTAAHQAPRPWNSPGKNTGVGCHFLFQCMQVKSESKVAQSCPTLSDPMDCSPPGSSVHGIFQARVLEWVASAFSNSMLQSAYQNMWHKNTKILFSAFIIFISTFTLQISIVLYITYFSYLAINTVICLYFRT